MVLFLRLQFCCLVSPLLVPPFLSSNGQASCSVGLSSRLHQLHQRPPPLCLCFSPSNATEITPILYYISHKKLNNIKIIKYWQMADFYLLFYQNLIPSAAAAVSMVLDLHFSRVTCTFVTILCCKIKYQITLPS